MTSARPTASTRRAASRRRRRRTRVAAVVALVLIVAAVVTVLWSRPSGTLYAVAGFETGDFSQWSAVQAISPARFEAERWRRADGRYAGRFVSVAGECLPMDCPRGRTEALLKGARHPVGEGDDFWYRWYTFFPADGPVQECTFTQWRADDERPRPGAVSGIYGLLTVGRSARYPGGSLTLQRNGDRWSGPLRRGAWIKFLVHIRYSSDPRKGLYELWVDGRHATSFHDRSKPPDAGVYVKQGVYRNAGTPTAVVYHDGLRIASTRRLADPGRLGRLLDHRTG